MTTTKEETKPYRLKKGKTHYMPDGENGVVEKKGGDVCQLTANQAHAFRDKFEPVGKAHAPLPPEATGIPEGNDEVEDSEDDEDDDEEDDEELPVGESEPGSPDESPIAIRRRQKAERKAARKAAREAKK